MSAFLGLLFLILAGFSQGEVLYVLGDEVVSVTDAGFNGVSGATAACFGPNTAAVMQAYIAAPTTTIVPVTVSLCGSYLSSDVLAGLDWIGGDIDYGVQNHIAVGLDLSRAGQASAVIQTQLATFLSNRAVVSTMQGYGTQKGVLLVPNATAVVAKPPQAPAAPPPLAPQTCPPAPVPPKCSPLWKTLVIGESAVLGIVLICACFVLGAWVSLRKRQLPAPGPMSYVSQSPRASGYPMYQHESIQMPPFVGACLDRDTLSAPDVSPRTPKPCRETLSSPDVMTAKWVPGTASWAHVPTQYAGPYGDLGMQPPPRVSISTSGIRDTHHKRKHAPQQPNDSDKANKVKFDFRRTDRGSPETMSSSRETPTNLSDRDLSQRGSV